MNMINENSEVLERTCRLCAKSTFNAKNLLDIFQIFDNDNGLEFLQYNLKIFKYDGLPQKLCRTCSQAFKRANEFIQKCKDAQDLLETKFPRIIQEEFINENDIKKSPIHFANDNQNVKINSNENVVWNNSKLDNLLQDDYNNAGFDQYITDDNDLDMNYKQKVEMMCKYCLIPYKSKNFKIHLDKFHPKDNPYLCLICFENFPTQLQHSKHSKYNLCKVNTDKLNINEKLKNDFNADENYEIISDNNSIQEHSINKNESKDYYDSDDNDENYENDENVENEYANIVDDKNYEIIKLPKKIERIKRKKSVWEKHRIYECEKCGNIFDKFRELLAHRKLNHSDEKEKYLCDFCGKEFKKRSAYSDHRNIHTQETPHKCAVCDKAFLNRHALKKHHRDNHSNKERITFPCEICGKIFLSTSALQNHVKTHSDGYEESLFQCKYCSKKFKLLATLTIHCNSHNKPKNSKHQCPECLQYFKRSDHMKEHLLSVHLKKFPFPCELCDKKFVTGAKRSTHVKLAHSGIRYPCNVYGCEKEFCSLFSLNRHKRKHNGEKRYKCEVCHETFATTIQISRHIEDHKLDENVKKQLIELTYANIQKEVETIDA